MRMDSNHSREAINDTHNNRQLDNVWVEIQQKTFTNWINEQLKPINLVIQNLETEFANGINLIALVECLQKRTLKKNRNPVNQHQCIENVQIALNAISSDNIKLVNIGSSDIISGNIKLILGLVWQLITRYHLGKATNPPKKLMLSWLEAALPDLNITNFTTDWNNGIALASLIEFCKPGSFPNWNKLNSKFGYENCRAAMKVAFEKFQIPIIITPEDLSNPNVDEKSALTYLSYFMKENGPGYNLTIEWARRILPNKNITNLTTDWNSGINLCCLLTELGINLPSNAKVEEEKSFWESNWQLALNSAKLMGIEPPIQLKAKHFTDPNIEHISIMAFLTKFMQFSQIDEIVKVIGVNLNNVFVNKEALFKLDIVASEPLELEQIRTEVHSPENKLITSEITVNKFGGHGKFTPNEAGIHDLKVYYKNNLAARPMRIRVHPDLTNVIFSGIEPCSVGSLVEVVINSNGAGSNDVKVTAHSSTGRELKCRLSENNNSLVANFIPDEIGEWRISITYSGEHINGSPFLCLVYDLNQIFVNVESSYNLNEEICLAIDAKKAGWGTLSTKVESFKSKTTVPTKVDERGDGVYKVSFKPELAEKHLVIVNFNNQNIPSSPFIINIHDPNTNTNGKAATPRINILGENLKQAQVGELSFFQLEGVVDFSNLFVQIKDATMNAVSYQINKNSDHSCFVEFRPTKVGVYTIDLAYGGRQLEGSPFLCQVYDLSKIKVYTTKTKFVVHQEVAYEVDVTDAGFGKLEAMVNNGQFPCHVRQLKKSIYHVSFNPTMEGMFLLDIKYNNKLLPNSPFQVDVFSKPLANIDVPKVVNVQTLETIQINQKASFDIYVESSRFSKDFLETSIVGLNNHLIEHAVIQDKANTFKVVFTLPQIGNYHFDVRIKNTSLNYHFVAKAYDIAKIYMSDTPKNIILNQTCAFQVDASQAGEGQLEIAVNDGDVPNQVQVLGNGKCLISFVPQQIVPHKVDIKFNNVNLIGCPFICTVIPHPTFKLDMSQAELVQQGQEVSFTIVSSCVVDKNVFAIKLLSPTNKPVPSSVTYGKVVHCVFVPNEVGPYLLNFEFASAPMLEKPAIIKCFDPSKVVVTPTINGYVDKPVQFVVDATYSGEGNLEISVLANEKNVPTQVQPMGGAKFGVTFLPTQAVDHLVSITFNNIAVTGNPFLVNILPSTDKPIITGASLHYSAVDQIAKLTIHNIETENDIIVKVQDGNNQIVPVNIIKDLQNNCVNLEYLPKIPGEYKVQLKYKGEHIQNSPYTTKIYDLRKIKVKDIQEEICLGKPVTFLVEATNAGPGNLEVIVNNGKVPSTPKSLGLSLYAITFVPTEPELHIIEIKFNGKHVENSPFKCRILDTEKVMVKRLEKVPVNKMAQFSVDTNGGLLNENSVAILGPSHHKLKPIINGDHLNGYQIQFNPTEVGDHAIDIKIGNDSIPGCPFLVKVYDSKNVKVGDITNAHVGQPVYFSIDASTAGAGNLEIIVSTNGKNVPNYVQSEGNARFRVNFKPTEASTHTISCKFNGEAVPNSPFFVKILDNDHTFGFNLSDVLFKNVSLKKGIDFRIENQNNEAEECQITVTAPSSKKHNPRIEKLDKQFSVYFLPQEVGPHQIMVHLDGMLVPGCPFTCNVYDVDKIKVNGLTNCILDKPFTCLVDASQAGEGTLELVVSTQMTSVRAEVLMRSRGFYDISFVPQDLVVHFLSMTFNDEEVPGSPFKIDVLKLPTKDEPKPKAQACLVNQVFSFGFESTTLTSPNLVITGPSKSKPTGALLKIDANKYKIEFKPKEIGKHKIEVLDHAKLIWERPVMLETFDVNKIVVQPTPNCTIGKECQFKVDTTKAGNGELRAKVYAADIEVPHHIKELGAHSYLLTFTPQVDAVHCVELSYNQVLLPNCPYAVSVQAHLESIIIYGEGLKSSSPNEKTVFYIETDGIPANEFDIVVTDPNRSPLPVKCYQQKNGSLLVEWIPKKIGPHKIEVFHSEKPVIGSPFNCQVFNASKVKIEPIDLTNFVINKKINLYLNRKNAGYAELDVTVTSPLGRHLPIDVKGMPSGDGELIEFVPTVPGKYEIAITYGGVEIPDSPITFIAQECIMPKVTGDGLHRGVVNEPCLFVIDAQGIYGSPEIKIDGPENETSFSMEKCNELYKITYTPLEIGIFDIKVFWNDQEIPESPFHPHIVNFDKVRLIGGWENAVDANNRINLCLGEEKRLTFDISEAGVGKLSAKLRHEVEEDLHFEQNGAYKFKLTLKPKTCGESELYIYFENMLIPRMPIIVNVQDNNSEGATVVLKGHGLAGARVCEEAEIIIDGKDAGDGEPEVSLAGVKSNIKVKLTPIGPRLYKATYIPKISGTYLLNVLWNQKQVKGCPLKISILPSCDAKRVVCSGDGLKGGTIGKEIKAFIDTRCAGPGELSAHCAGPTKSAICELYDQNDGTFTLVIHPQEGGKHTLNIKYGGQHVIGSPYNLKIYSTPDASKVNVVGPGVEHGVLPIYQSHFICDTKGAGVGQLTVRIRGPKGAFRVEMQRETQKDRAIFCKYDPTEPGDYRIEVKWAGEHVPGSPFFVVIFDTQEELNRYRMSQKSSLVSLPPLNAIERFNLDGPGYSEDWKQISWKHSTADMS